MPRDPKGNKISNYTDDEQTKQNEQQRKLIEAQAAEIKKQAEIIAKSIFTNDDEKIDEVVEEGFSIKYLKLKAKL